MTNVEIHFSRAVFLFSHAPGSSDGSVQPYGLVVPASYQAPAAQKFRLDFWFHGRGETLTELDFINGRQKSPGEFTPPNTFRC